MAWKWANLVNLSIITYMVSCFLLVPSNPIIKPVVTSFHFHFTISKRVNNVQDCWYSIFTCWYKTHLDTYSTTSFFMFGHQKLGSSSWYILVPPRWSTNLDLSKSVNTSFLSFSLSWSPTLPLISYMLIIINGGRAIPTDNLPCILSYLRSSLCTTQINFINSVSTCALQIT